MSKVNPLIVIDMQPDFFWDLEEYWDSHVVPFVKRACLQVRKALRQNRPVLIVEMAYNETTFEDIRYEISPTWGSIKPIKKKCNDGGPDCIRELDRMGLDIGHVEVLGVNWDYCVAETVITLSDRFPCKILSSATANAFHPCLAWNSHDYVLRAPPKGDIKSVLSERPPEDHPAGWARILWRYTNKSIEVV